MKNFKDKITLTKNGRGCYILDTIKGCSVCANEKPGGCYGDCYAKKITLRYGIDFSTPIEREFPDDGPQLRLFDFDDALHAGEIISKLRNIEMPFVRIGDMGDPSENWEHTLKVCNIIRGANKNIVIITKHWHAIPEDLLPKTRGLFINTSISALDSDEEIAYRLAQFERLKPYCNSILRIVSCNFNTTNVEGARRSSVQLALFNNKPIIDTVFRPSAGNPLVTSKVINVERGQFMRSTVLMSRFNENAYLGLCNDCPDMCGVNI